MKSFIEFLNETKWDGLVYHATYNDFDPERIKPGSHFGTLKAAMSRGSRLSKGVRGIDPEGHPLRVHAYQYNPSKTKKLAPKTIRDPGNNEPLKRAGGFNYANEYEHPGSISHIVHDTSRLQHVHSFMAPKYINRKRDFSNDDGYINPKERERGVNAETRRQRIAKI